jgi:lysophospholipase L1-like esterase
MSRAAGEPGRDKVLSMCPSIEPRQPELADSIEEERGGWSLLAGATDRLLGSRGKTVLWILFYAALFSNARFFLGATSGVVTYVLVTVMLLTPILAVKEAGELTALLLARPISLTLFSNLALVATSVMLTFVLLETVLQVAARFQNSGDNSAFLRTLAMPPEWEKRPAQVEGDEHAYYWHNALHVHNRDRMRRVGAFPPKLPGTLRIIALGDSLTYGYGIAEEDTYVQVLERDLRKTFRVEVLNLGVSGAQSEDVLKILRRHFFVLQPDVVVYGVCLNDFLPSGVGEYDSNRAYPVPLPFKDHFIAKTLTGKLLERQYDALLMRWGLRADFITDILKDFDGYQTRFAGDVKAMNAFVRAHGLPSMLAMVLDQTPSTREKRYAIVQAAERHLRGAGIRVVPSDYIQRNDGRRDWFVSRWEGHPNEKANRAFAEEIAKVLVELPELQSYRRTAGDGARNRTSPPPRPSEHG